MRPLRDALVMALLLGSLAFLASWGIGGLAWSWSRLVGYIALIGALEVLAWRHRQWKGSSRPVEEPQGPELDAPSLEVPVEEVIARLKGEGLSEEEANEAVRHMGYS